MTQPYAPGSTIPIQPWLIDAIRSRLQHKHANVRNVALREQYLVERARAWQVYPVRIGRWQRVSITEGAYQDGSAFVVAMLTAPFRLAEWKPARNLMQVLDPSTRQPISEMLIATTRDGWAAFNELTELAFLGDPRVGGYIAQPEVAAAPVLPDPDHPRLQYLFIHNRRGPDNDWSVQTFETEGPRLAALPYRDFADRDDGPWLDEHPDKPKSSNQWKPSPWYQA